MAIETVNQDFALTFRGLGEQVDSALTRERLMAQMAGFFGVLAMLLAGLGLYGVTSYAMLQRRGEIAIRLALGATSAAVVRHVLARVSLMVGVGIAAGVIVSLWATKFVEGLIYDLAPRDAATMLFALIALAAIGALAGYLPARRAARLDPLVALRES